MEKRNESNMLIKNDLQTEITRLKKVVQDQKNEIEKPRRENSAWIPVSTGIFPRDKEIVQVTYLGFSDEKPCCEAFAFRKNGDWYWYSKGTRITVKITAWKPKCKAYEEKEMYDGIFKLAGLIKLMAEDVSKEDSWWKCEYIGPAIGLRETKNFWDEISVTDDSGYRYDDGRVVANITNKLMAAVKPENSSKSLKRSDVYTEWFESEQDAAEFVQDARCCC